MRKVPEVTEDSILAGRGGVWWFRGLDEGAALHGSRGLSKL